MIPGDLVVFVYGTLKQGHRNHAGFCTGVTSITPARVRGRLFVMPQGYPMMVVPEPDVLATGTEDARQDLETFARHQQARGEDREAAQGPRFDGWREIPGELMTFADAEYRLPLLDDLESFRPSAASLYRRVLLPLCDPPGQLAWVYVAPADLDQDVRRHLEEIDSWELTHERR